MIWRRNSYPSWRLWVRVCVFIVFCDTAIVAGVLLLSFKNFFILPALPHAIVLATFGGECVARKARNRKRAGE